MKMECKVCWKVFITSQDARDHYNIFKSHENYEIYTKNKPFECEFCKVRFIDQKELNQHKKIHEKISIEPDLKKKEEDKTLKNKKEFTGRIGNYNDELNTKSQFVCDICEESFGQLKCLQIHIVTHTTTRNEKCSRRSSRNSKKKLDSNKTSSKINIPEKQNTINSNILTKPDNCLDESVNSHIFDSADVRVVELNAKAIELSSDEEIKIGDFDIIKDEIFFNEESQCSPFSDFVAEEEIKNETDLHITAIKKEIEFDDTNGSDDFPLNQLIKKNAAQKSKECIKKEIKTEVENNIQIPSDDKKNTQKKPVTKKRNSKKEKKAKVDKVLPDSDKNAEISEILVVQPDIFFDNNKAPKKPLENSDDNYNNILPKHRCSTCGERRSNKRLLQQHKQIHLGLSETECKVCKQMFGTPQEVLLHFDSFRKEKTDQHYQEGRPYQCKDCDSRFIHLKHLYEHRKIHIGDKKYLCKICGKSFLRKQGLQWHLETHLSDELDAESLGHLQGVKVRDNMQNKKMFVCDMCGHEFKQSSQLKIHINRHVKLKRFTCTICAKSFVTPRDLLKHSRTHTGERPYKCSYCEKSFIDSGDRIKHERLHTGEKPYTCQTCGKKFTFSSGLRTHERAVHFGLKRYNCDKCTRGFSNKSCLLKHKAKIHLQR